MLNTRTQIEIRNGQAIALCDALSADQCGGLIANCVMELNVSGGVPDWVELMPAGEFKPRDSRAPWNNHNPEAVVAASRALAMDLPIDYEHQTDYATKNGQPAPAAGWIKELDIRAGAIWGRVEWTGKARAMLAAREYRFLSPTFEFTKDSRAVTRLLRAALTNDPALHLTALATNEGSDMDRTELLKLLGLDETADDKAVAKALATLTGTATALAAAVKESGITADADPAKTIAAIVAAAAPKDGASLTAIAKAAGLDADADAAAIETAVATAVARVAGAGSPDPSEFVPRSEFDNMQTQLAALQKDGAESKATAAVDAAIEAGKVTPASRDWALAYATKDAAGFAEFVGSAPAIVSPGSNGNPSPPKAGSALTADELETCRVTGTDPEVFKKQRDALSTEEAA